MPNHRIFLFPIKRQLCNKILSFPLLGSSHNSSKCQKSKIVHFRDEDHLFFKYIRWDTNIRMRYDKDFNDCHSSKVSLRKCVDLKIGPYDPRNWSSSRTFRHSSIHKDMSSYRWKWMQSSKRTRSSLPFCKRLQ